ncbi:MAG: ribosome biogenesis GTP-binding protein YihA/YsxC [Arsenophonus sp. NEOnobi-MAG3]
MTKKNYNYHQTKFVISAPNIRYLPNYYGIEIAFAGRSNAGKSSTLNALTQQKNLARTSKTPGRTQLINLFEVAEGIRLVDLPGYGYAEVPESVKRQWQQALSEYLQKRKCLKGLIILMDIRHPLKDLDIQMIKLAIVMNIPILVLLTKADKLVPNKQKAQVIAVRNRLKTVANNIEVEIFSSLKKIGIDKLQFKLNEWFNKQHYK